MEANNKPRLFEGGLAIDDRGELGFINSFNFPDIKRFYTVTNHYPRFVRAWHAHKLESKYATVVNGAALFGIIEIDNWVQPSKNTEIHRFVLSAKKPTIVYIPKGYAHGYMTFTADTKIVFFSTSTLEESSKDDYRYDAHYWDIWNIVER